MTMAWFQFRILSQVTDMFQAMGKWVLLATPMVALMADTAIEATEMIVYPYVL
jgi:hypothetical protein